MLKPLSFSLFFQALRKACVQNQHAYPHRMAFGLVHKRSHLRTNMAPTPLHQLIINRLNLWQQVNRSPSAALLLTRYVKHLILWTFYSKSTKPNIFPPKIVIFFFPVEGNTHTLFLKETTSENLSLPSYLPFNGDKPEIRCTWKA